MSHKIEASNPEPNKKDDESAGDVEIIFEEISDKLNANPEIIRSFHDDNARLTP